MKPCKPAFAAVIASTIAWSLSLFTLMSPAIASAATSGSLVRASTHAVYYVGADGKRYVFPNEKTYKTWYADFGAVITVTDAELAAMTIGGNVTYNPGVKMVKITTDPKVYAVDHNGTLRWIKTESIAAQLYGANWSQLIDDVPDAFFINYMLGADIASTANYSPTSVRAAATSINADRNMVSSGTSSGSGSSSGNAMLSMKLPSTPAAQTFIQGTQDAAMFGITLTASTGDVTISGISVTCYVDGNLDSSFKQGQDNVGETKRCTDIIPSASLMDGTTSLGTASPTSSSAPGNGGVIQFSGLNVLIPAGQSRTFTVSADLAGTIAKLNDRIQLRAAAASDVIGRNAAGNTVSPTGAPLIGPIMTIAPNGTGTATAAPSDADTSEGVVIAGLSETVLAKYRLTAQSEDLKLVKARMRTAASAAPAILSVSLYDGDERVGGPVPIVPAGYADLSGMNVLIPKNSSKTVTVKATLNSVGPSGAASGTDVTMTFDDGDDGTGSANGTLEIRGASIGSSTLITHLGSLSANDSMAGETKIIRKTRPTVSLASLTSTVLTNGTVPIFRFTAAADPAEQVSLKKITFQANISDGGGTALALSGVGADSSVREVGQGSDIAGQASFSGCSGSGTCTIKIAFANEQSIAAGSSKTYDLRVYVNGADRVGESISASILGDAADDTGTLTGADPNTKVAGTAYDFIWSDNSAVPHLDTVGASSSDWSTGRFVKVLQSDSETVLR